MSFGNESSELDPRGPAMTVEEANEVIDAMGIHLGGLMENGCFLEEMGKILESFRELRREHGDGSEGASQRMDNLELMVTTMMERSSRP